MSFHQIEHAADLPSFSLVFHYEVPLFVIFHEQTWFNGVIEGIVGSW